MRKGKSLERIGGEDERDKVKGNWGRRRIVTQSVHK